MFSTYPGKSFESEILTSKCFLTVLILTGFLTQHTAKK